MKIKISKLIVIIFAFSFGCDWMYVQPVTGGVFLYKTKGDYRYLYDIYMSGNEISAVNFWGHGNTIFASLDKDTIYDGRQKVVHGFILDEDANLADVYLSLTHKEIVLKEIVTNNPGKPLPDDTLRKYILDKDPYLEFYECTTTLKLGDSVKINQIILRGEIEKYFKRLK